MMESMKKKSDTSGFETSAWKCPITLERPLASGIDGAIRNPGLARASLAVSTDRPDGDEEYSNSGKRSGYVKRLPLHPPGPPPPSPGVCYSYTTELQLFVRTY